LWGDALAQGIGEHGQADGDDDDAAQDLPWLARLVQNLVESFDLAKCDIPAFTDGRLLGVFLGIMGFGI